MNAENKELLKNLYFPAMIILIIWMVKLVEFVFDIDFAFLGILPLNYNGLIGIITAPLIHSDLDHLIANSIPLFVLGASLFYFYRQIAYKIFFLIYLLTNVWVWFLARGEAYHIGASGLIYGLAAYLFVSGLVRKNPRLMAITLIITFLYGSMIWGVFPEFFPEKNISWESHLMGLVAGLVLALLYRNEGPKAKVYHWDDEDLDDDDPYWEVKDSSPSKEETNS